jgi:hypothetical protein
MTVGRATLKLFGRASWPLPRRDAAHNRRRRRHRHSALDELRRAGVDFRGDTITGRGGRQALALDPSGNLVELFEAYQG